MYGRVQTSGGEMSQKFIIKKTLDRFKLRQIEQRIGNTLRDARMHLGFSMVDLANAAGTSHQQIHKIERGINRLTLSRFHIFVTHLGISARSFYETAFDADWEKGIQLESSFKVKLFAVICELNEEERTVIFDLIRVIRRANKRHRT